MEYEKTATQPSQNEHENQERRNNVDGIVNAPSTCRQHDRQRSLQEMVKRTAKNEHPIQEDLEKRKLKLTHFYPPGRKIEKTIKSGLDEVRE